MASGQRDPAGWVDVTNYLVNSVNRSHSDWAHLKTELLLVSDVCRVSSQLLRLTVVPGEEGEKKEKDHCRRRFALRLCLSLGYRFTTAMFSIVCTDAMIKPLGRKDNEDKVHKQSSAEEEKHHV